MNYKTFKPLVMLAITAFVITLASCSKEDTVPAAIEEEIQAGEFLAKEPASGTYGITKFIDNGDNETAQFIGYSFQFVDDGTFIAITADSTVVTGTWQMNPNETMLKIQISGTQNLNDIDETWRVVQITDDKITLRAAGPDRVVFTKL